jgi:hypothetical protein
VVILLFVLVYVTSSLTHPSRVEMGKEYCGGEEI